MLLLLLLLLWMSWTVVATAAEAHLAGTGGGAAAIVVMQRRSSCTSATLMERRLSRKDVVVDPGLVVQAPVRPAAGAAPDAIHGVEQLVRQVVGSYRRRPSVRAHAVNVLVDGPNR